MEDVNQEPVNSGAEGCEEEGKGVHVRERPNMFIKTTQHYKADR